MKQILVTPRSLSCGRHVGLERLESLGFTLVRPTPGEMPSETDLLDAIRPCCGWIAGVEPVSARIIEAAEELCVISRNGSGVDNLPMDVLERRKIVVKRAEGVNANGVAELALALMLAGFRQIPLNDRGIRAGDWPRVSGREIAGAIIGVVGLGAIGGAVCEKFLSLGVRVVGFDPFSCPKHLQQHSNFCRAEAFEELVSQSDGITLHIPLPPQQAPLFDEPILSIIKPGLVIVNTARAGLIHPEALLDALNTGRVSAYATDVYHDEPPRPSPLLQHERCIMTSHIGGLTTENVERITRVTVDNLLAGLEASHD